MKARLDKLLVDRGLATRRERAQALILSGNVLVGEAKVSKAGSLVEDDAALRLLEVEGPYVGRGGFKLEAALRGFGISAQGRVALDVGAGTGGFTDCLLQHGAARVYAVDVGYGQLAWRLRQDPRVVVLERTHIRRLDPARLEPRPDLATIDVSFISLRLVLPEVLRCLAFPAEIVALVKPQFEVGKGMVGKGGVVRDPILREETVRAVQAAALALGLEEAGLLPSPIPGQKGNVEYLLYLRTGGGR
ncbi:MAG: TlyA family RNA methyltransferase [Nitrospirae bacterium]|nr:TlyA family RNA methyltransferase [Nitrospirota bacterium]